MEPDFDRILSRKIRETEQRPVSWNKQDVWRSLQAEAGTGRRNFYFYYVAAAAISLLVYFAIEPIAHEVKPPFTDVKTPPQIQPDELTTPVTAGKKHDRASEPVLVDPDNTKVAVVIEKPDTNGNIAQPTQSELPDMVPIAEPVSELQIPVENREIAETLTVPEQKIRPVVGIITESYPDNLANAKRKKRLRKLKPSDPMPWEDPNNALVFAVRNNH